MSRLNVLYEDNHIIAVVKPSGMLTQGDKSGEISLFDEIKKYLKEKYKKPGNVFLGLVHRLDKPVSGIVLFGKTSKGASRLSEQFRNRTIKKVYYAIVLGKPKENKGVLKEKINKISFFAKAFVRKNDEELLKEIKKAIKERTAEMSWELLKTNGRYSLLKIIPKTGRFHQIRTQLANMGHPVVGDLKYGYETNKKIIKKFPWLEKSIALCAAEISFKSVSGIERKEINLKISLPEAWNEIFKD